MAQEVRNVARGLSPQHSTVLDVGCGPGPLGTLLAGEELHLYGIDSERIHRNALMGQFAGNDLRAHQLKLSQ